MDNPRFGAPYWIRGRSERPNDGAYLELKFLIMGQKWEKIGPCFYEFLESFVYRGSRGTHASSREMIG